MVVITLTVIEAAEQFISGIPKTLTLTTNVAAMVFYTLDGSTPTTGSSVYITPIELPTNQSAVEFKAFATNGVDNSAIFSKRYSPDISHARVPFAKAEILNPTPNAACGVNGDPPEVLWSQPAGNPQNAFDVVNVDEDGYGSDPAIFPVREYDQPIPTYDWEYSESNWKGETSIGDDIGTLPAKTQIVYTPPAPEQSELNRATYDPRALVTFHFSDQPNENSDTLFRPYFNGQDYEKDMYGTRLSTTAFRDGAGCPSGSFLKYHYNPTKNTITFYYYDNYNCRWIISEESVKSALPNPNQQNAIYNFIGPSIGDKHVYRWIPFGHGGTFCI